VVVTDAPEDATAGAAESTPPGRSRAGLEQLAWVLVLYLAGVLLGLLLARVL
jgi:hypothetical protein